MEDSISTRPAYRDFNLLLFVLLCSGFVFIAAQRIGEIPLPETDEAFTLQVPYEMLNRGHIALPMFRYLGGNIETSWHSYTPVFFVWLWGFFKVFGYGLLQGRIFNLITALLTLIMTYLIGRRLIQARAGLIAAIFLISDLTFLERSRFLRNDYAAAFFALLTFYLYELAEKRKRASLFVASGLAAGAGVMCHTNILYMLGAIGLLMLLREGWRVFSQPKLYQFGVSAFAVMAYEILYDIIDYKNFTLQNRADSLHFSIFEAGGVLRNITGEAFRYEQWYTAKSDHYGVLYGVVIADLPRTLNHMFILFTAGALIYLCVLSVKRFRRREAIRDIRVRIFIVTIFCVLFHAVITGHKEIYYFAHLAPWFALSVGIALNDGFRWIQSIEGKKRLKPVLNGIAVVAIGVFGFLLIQQYARYYRAVNNPDLVTFNEYKSVLRDIVPEGVCPVTKRSPVIWLAFEEDDQCFASIDHRMKKVLDFVGKDFVYITPNESIFATDGEEKGMHFLGELKDTAYDCNFRVFYTGTNPQYLALTPKYYQFNGWNRGHTLISDQPINSKPMLLLLIK